MAIFHKMQHLDLGQKFDGRTMLHFDAIFLALELSCLTGLIILLAEYRYPFEDSVIFLVWSRFSLKSHAFCNLLLPTDLICSVSTVSTLRRGFTAVPRSLLDVAHGLSLIITV